eukprot:CAMPEP_0197308270 /NCGR_PEP_ID=MMETSP0891-20130614/6596_1 /TAXON_ID=44058 ORGANISM="Aureoumbra lagunensis, Strain CCMP1510" /NCGR_SAMPLE_ID=MMETSP0891 /ASSEMBLY_ACC=CAM_ASM_000534 /LENGTH=235 /DNA_ID=CAMNT_0042792545 /DNA_START=782 /DNA_END=1486 /DNA_ORIENTATION=+
MCGDWNVCFRDESRQNGDLPHYNSPEWLKWFRLREEDPFVNAFYLRGHPPAYTFNRAGSTSDLDAFIGRQSFLDATLTKAAIYRRTPGNQPLENLTEGQNLVDRQLSASCHAPILAEFNFAAQLGSLISAASHPRVNPYQTTFSVLTSDINSVELFQDFVQIRICKSALEERIATLSTEPIPTPESLDALMEEIIETLLLATADVKKKRTARFHNLIGKQAFENLNGAKTTRQAY